MSGTLYCRVCNGAFPASELVEETCGSCRENKAKPHATHRVFSADDLDWHGRRNWWGPVLGTAVLAGAVWLWQSGSSMPTVELDPARATTLDGLLAEEDPEWIQAFDQEIRSVLAADVARMRRGLVNAGSEERARSLGLLDARKALRWTLTVDWRDDGPWIVATPEPPLSRHILVSPKGEATSAFGEPATDEDETIVWLEPKR